MTDKSSDIIQAWDAFIAPTEKVDLRKTNGRIAASTIRQYPPGIPEIIPGMTYSSQIVESLETAHVSGSNIIGVNMDGDRKVEVVATHKSIEDRFKIQTHHSHALSDDTVDEVADFFRVGFYEAPYFHFAFHETDPLQSLPHTLDFEAYAVSVGLADPVARKSCQDALRSAAYQKAVKGISTLSFESVVLPTGFHLWTDRLICREKIRDRLSDDGYVTIIRDSQNGGILGLLHARMGTVERLYETEEWSDPLLFSQFEDEKLRDDPERFFHKVQYHFGLKPDNSVMTISAQILDPKIQGGDVFYKMMRSMADRIKPEHAALPILSEIPPHGTAHTLNIALNDRLVFGVLKNDHPVVFCSQMSQSLFLIVGGKQHWNYALRKAAREKREYRTQFYVSQTSDHGGVEVKPNGKLGLAVFATEDIPAGTRIAVFTGEKYQSDTALGLPKIMRDHAIQVDHDQYVFGYKGLAHCLCHSCEPNCGIRELTEIFTVRDIARGEQLTWDYRCSENSNWVLEACLCGSERCTGIVAGFDSLPADIKAEYLGKSMISEWIVSSF